MRLVIILPETVSFIILCLIFKTFSLECTKINKLAHPYTINSLKKL